MRPTQPGTLVKMRNPDAYTGDQLKLLATVVMRLNRGTFHYVEAPHA